MANRQREDTVLEAKKAKTFDVTERREVIMNQLRELLIIVDNKNTLFPGVAWTGCCRLEHAAIYRVTARLGKSLTFTLA